MKKTFTTKCKVLCLALSLSGFGSFTQAQLLMEEDFNFTTGTDVVGQNGWSKGSTETNNVTVVSPGLAYPGYPNVETTNAATFVPTTCRIQKNFEGGSLSGTYYYSFLINVSSALATGDFFIGFYSNAAFRGRTYLKSSGTGFQLGLVKTTTGTVTYTSGTPLSFGTTYLVVVKYEFQPGTTDDIVSLYVNPNLSQSALGTPDVGPLTDAGNDVTSNVLALQGRANTGNFVLDGIRVATSWAGIKGETIKTHSLELPKFLSSNMVLQRETPLKFFGWGTAGDTVKVEFKREGIVLKDSIEVGSDNCWKIQLPEQTACTEACELKISVLHQPQLSQTLTNILVGDVWFAGGQSNMEKKVSHLLDAEDFIREADNYQLIRSCRAAYNAINELQDRVNGSSTPWFVCNSAEVGEKVAAVAYVFARRVFEQTNIPIGIMQSYRGGTELETWMSQEKLTTDPGLRKVAGRKASQDPSSTANYQSIHFNGQINPLIGFPIKGFLWYQGESNIKRALEYRFMMKKLIEDYRTLWNMGDLPFYYVQMFNILAASEFEEGNWTDIREQQAFLLLDNVKNIGMAVGIDTNEDPTNKDDAVRMHPKNKTPIGERMARIALKNTYGFNDMLAEGPSISRYKVSNDTIYLYFKNYGTGLKIKDGEATLKGFAISGADKSFKIATATITNDSTVAVKSSLVPNPVAARYAWARNPICNLYNSENIPASTSRTDIWPSKVTYENFTSTFNADEDADLMAIKINGTPLGEFNPQQLEYTITVDGNFLDVTAIKNSPFSKLEITKNAAGDEVTLTVTAENLSQKVYKVKLHSSTGKKDIVADSFPINIFQEGKLMVLENKSENNYSVRIYNATGLCLIADSLNQNAQKGYALAAGAYIVYLNSASESKCVKFLLKS